MPDLFHELFDELDLLTVFEKERFDQIESPDVEALSEKGALVNGHWLPKARMRVDSDRNLYLESWLFAKNF